MRYTTHKDNKGTIGYKALWHGLVPHGQLDSGSGSFKLMEVVH